MAKLAEEMNPEGSRYQLLLSCPSGLSPSQVSVDFSKSHDRIPHQDPGLEDSISQVWEQRSQGNSSLFNGQKFRYGGYCLDDDDGSTNEVPHVCLRLGLTDYRTFVGTNLSSLWEKFLVTSEDDSVRCRHTSSPLGNGAVIETSDKKIIVLRRSNNVGEFPGHYVFPGGHPEPTAVGIDYHQLENNVQTGEVLNKKVTQEMFDSIICEVVEETGIPASSLSSPLFIGISRRELNVRPAMFFYLKCSHHSDDIQRLYSSAEDGFESTQLHTVSLDELKMMTSRMPGCHHGGFALYELMLQRLKNTKETSLIAT
ncbi:Nudix hydrolase 9 [Arabidopsis thaliana]|uniref:NUDT9 n=3 Tax=Arabidopsis TaxID=3701 RepID=A0A178VKK5_ARATH|nr:NUDIX hydrolase-like domain superfamily [Arabidopsis thaliana x Arabidopsis arenosa]KAG7633460.1 NUDIX hydrolase-like domain superfamily [Arabidopsis suecica]OAP05603.1 NUDT9 [Arabidopsis thaliana]